VKRKKTVSHENHERWLVSYADFITLLFAFFVVMFASSQADKTKAKAISESVREALDNGQFSKVLATVLGRGRHEAALAAKLPPRPDAQDNTPPPPLPKPDSAAGDSRAADLVKPLETLQRGLEVELKSGKVELKLEARGLVISLREAAFFGSGDDAVAPGSLPILVKIAAVIQALPNPLRLEGYTDSVPIHNSRFRNNWELSTARGIAMLELLRQRHQIAPGRMSVAGYAENAPSDTNDTEEGRAHNRRVDVVVLSAEALKIEPQGTPQKPSPAAAPAAAPAAHSAAVPAAAPPAAPAARPAAAPAAHSAGHL
jgi:chemotaxis protein MotB